METDVDLIGQIWIWGTVVVCGFVLIAATSHWVARTVGQRRDARRGVTPKEF